MRGGAIFKAMVQWIIVPIGLLVVGYFILGPQIGSKASAKTVAINNSGPPSVDESVPPAPGGEVPVHSGEPEVTVTVKRGGMFHARDFTPEGDYRGTYSHRRRHHSRRSSDSTSARSANGDSASSDSSTDTSVGAVDSNAAGDNPTPRRRHHRRRRSSSTSGTTAPSDTGDGTTGGTGGTTG